MTKKLDGDDFKPDTLKSIKGIINRYLMGKHSIFNIIEDKEFLFRLNTSRKVVSAALIKYESRPVYF